MPRYSDFQLVPLPGALSPQGFAGMALGGVPRWLTFLLDVRDVIVARFGFAIQSKPHEVSIAVGEALGPFVISDVSDEMVRAGNSDRHIRFETVFTTAAATDGTHLGIMSTTAVGQSVIGGIYLRII